MCHSEPRFVCCTKSVPRYCSIDLVEAHVLLHPNLEISVYALVCGSELEGPPRDPGSSCLVSLLSLWVALLKRDLFFYLFS